jgi:NitT/TauT family transport system ATP-binding protein
MRALASTVSELTNQPAAAGREIALDGLRKVFRSRDGSDTVAVADIKQFIASGAFVSIVGPSGCGKSTILRMIAGLIAPTEGRVLLSGELVNEPSPEIGIAFQRPVLLPWLTVRRNVSLPAELAGRWNKNEIAERVDRLLELVRLPAVGTRLPSELSGGMQQRVAIARALMTDPGVILMDEPFGALDALTREHLNEELLAIWERTRATVVFITHDIGEAVYLSDRVLVMSSRPGRVIADITIPLPRPRENSMRGATEFVQASMQIRALIPH